MTNLNWLQPILIGHFNQLKNCIVRHDFVTDFAIDKTITDRPPKKRSFRSLLGTIVLVL